MPIIFSGKRDIFIEVAERYERYIRTGVLQDGDKLPSVRVAAEELGVNPNTVQKAYCHLEKKGLIYSLPKKGVFVTYTDKDSPLPDTQQTVALKALYELKELGLTKNEIISMLKEVYGDD